MCRGFNIFQRYSSNSTAHAFCHKRLSVNEAIKSGLTILIFKWRNHFHLPKHSYLVFLIEGTAFHDSPFATTQANSLNLKPLKLGKAMALGKPQE